MKRVLFLDDETAILNTYKRAVRNINSAEFYYFTTTKDAECFFNKEEIDLFISDYRLEHETGLEFLQKIRKKNETIPMIIISGYAEETLIKKALNGNIIQDYLIKPISLNMFNELIHKYLKEESNGKPIS